MLLRVDPDTGLERQHVADRIGAEGVAFQARVAAAFDELADAEPDRFLVVDATQPLDEVVAAARGAIGAVT
jgi:dTMP kinase